MLTLAVGVTLVMISAARTYSFGNRNKTKEATRKMADKRWEDEVCNYRRGTAKLGMTDQMIIRPPTHRH